MALTRELLDRYIAERDSELYHCTPAENVLAICREGLRPGCDSQYDPELLRPGRVYLCDAERAATDQAGYAADWGDAVFAVDLARLDPAAFGADEDYWRGELFDRGLEAREAAVVLRELPHIDEPEHVLASLLDGGTCTYAGAIPPVALRVAYLGERPDLPELDPLRIELRRHPRFGRGITDPELLRRFDLVA